MEFQRNLQEIKADTEREADSFCVEPCKLEVNRILFQYMPANTTLRECEDLACAIMKTIQDAWYGREMSPR